jgi:hypothetical protein
MARVSLTAQMVARGFDLSRAVPFERGVRVRCSACAALVINGVPCHEHGCPNRPRTCPECGGLDSEGTCCGPVEMDGWDVSEVAL